jgi:hypothetical protein
MDRYVAHYDGVTSSTTLSDYSLTLSGSTRHGAPMGPKALWTAAIRATLSTTELLVVFYKTDYLDLRIIRRAGDLAIYQEF